MNNIKGLRRALLGGAALIAMIPGVRADELAALKGQIEALQSRVDKFAQAPAPGVQAPAGTKVVSFERGSRMDFVAPGMARDRGNADDDAGFTIAITPSADLPAPVAEIALYGYVKGDVIYDLDGNANKFSFSMPGQDLSNGDDDEFVFLHAAQSRFGIKSKVDSAVGQIRTRIEMDFEQGDCREEDATDFCPRMRHVYGEWDMTPNWTLLVGQTDQAAMLSIIGVTTVDFYGDAGINGGARHSQLRLTYHDGPLSWAVSMERPEEASNTLIPDFASFIQYDVAGGHQLIIAGQISDLGKERSGDGERRLGWVIGGGANVNLADIATLTAGAQYTRGLTERWLNQLDTARRACELDPVTFELEQCELIEGFGVTVGMTFNVNESTSINVEGGYAENLNADEGFIPLADHVWTVHGNLLWQPVKQMRMGWEVMWGKEGFPKENGRCVMPGKGGDDCTNDALRFQMGTWFFF
jgi:opacity protein-like surface antigen